MSKLLRIAIPTYNRHKNLGKQIDFFKEELLQVGREDIEFIVYNNASTDNTALFLEDLSKKDKWLNIVNNPENIGLVGNIHKCFLESHTTYTWAVGDDDILEKGIVNKIVNVLKDSNYSWLFINHNAFDETTKQVKLSSSVNFKGGEFNDGKQVITNIFNFSRTTPMFITACIYNTSDINKIIKTKTDTNLVYPLEYSFFAASMGKVYVFDEILIHNKWGTTSWRDEVKNVMYYGVFKVLESLGNYGFSKKQIVTMKRINLIDNLRNQIRGTLQLDIFSIKLFRYYNVEVIKKIFNILYSK